eukprot:4368582-Amphidinium_carterae.3
MALVPEVAALAWVSGMECWHAGQMANCWLSAVHLHLPLRQAMASNQLASNHSEMANPLTQVLDAHGACFRRVCSRVRTVVGMIMVINALKACSYLCNPLVTCICKNLYLNGHSCNCQAQARNPQEVNKKYRKVGTGIPERPHELMT